MKVYTYTFSINFVCVCMCARLRAYVHDDSANTWTCILNTENPFSLDHVARNQNIVYEKKIIYIYFQDFKDFKDFSKNNL
jgi:hypothetical protein